MDEPMPEGVKGGLMRSLGWSNAGGIIRLCKRVPCRLSLGPKGDGVCHGVASIPLPEIQVGNRIGLLQRAQPLQILHETHDFNAVGPDDHHAPDRSAVRPEVAGERLVHLAFSMSTGVASWSVVSGRVTSKFQISPRLAIGIWECVGAWDLELGI